jgi:undecaprenyl-diphosphatase
LLVGSLLVAVSVVAAVVVARHPEATPLDRLGFDIIPKATRSKILIKITDLGTPLVLVLATIAAALVALGHDRRRALACVAGPVLVAFLVEYTFKPLVGRHFEGALSYPSGNVADVAAVLTAWSLAVPSRYRGATIAVGVVLTGLMVVAVIGLRWHYPSDALAGLVLGVGMVLLIDGSFHATLPDDRHADQTDPIGP